MDGAVYGKRREEEEGTKEYGWIDGVLMMIFYNGYIRYDTTWGL